MFREMRRQKQRISEAECIEILKNEPRGVLSMLGDCDYPYGVPINQFYCEENGHIYFHGGKVGHRVDAIKKHDKVSLCVYDSGYRKEGEWALNIKSVIVFGRIKIVDNYDEMVDICRRLSYKFTKNSEYIEREIKKYASATLLMELIPEHMTGKLVNEA